MSRAGILPQGFAVLEPFAPGWALPTTAERAQRRSESTPEERTAFFAAAAPLLEPVLDRLDTAMLASLNPAEQRLMDLMLAFAHVALAIEMQGPDEARHAAGRERMRITRSAADAGASA